jgi:hypothetical protein
VCVILLWIRSWSIFDLIPLCIGYLFVPDFWGCSPPDLMLPVSTMACCPCLLWLGPLPQHRFSHRCALDGLSFSLDYSLFSLVCAVYVCLRTNVVWFCLLSCCDVKVLVELYIFDIRCPLNIILPLIQIKCRWFRLSLGKTLPKPLTLNLNQKE